MYPDITPKLKLQGTISNPLEPAEVVGFEGRNKSLGRTAVVIKEVFTFPGPDTTVAVPAEKRDLLEEDGADLIVLSEESVWAMTGEDFAEESWSVRHRPEPGADWEMMPNVKLNSENFRQFDRSAVEIGNG